jgi:hypothetical protein
MNEEQLEELLAILECPIMQSGELFANPMVATDGHTYEASFILQWLARDNPISPTTRERIANSASVNFVVVKIIELLTRIRPELKSRLFTETSLATLDYFVNNRKSLIGFGEISLEEYIARFDEISPTTRLEALNRLADVDSAPLLRLIVAHEPLLRIYLTRGGNPKSEDVYFFWLTENNVAQWALTLPNPHFVTLEYVTEFVSYSLSKQQPLTLEGIPIDHPRYADIACLYAMAGGPVIERSLAIQASLEARLKLVERVFVDNLFSKEEELENKPLLDSYGYTNLIFHKFQKKSFRWLVANPEGLKQVWRSLHADYIRHPLSGRIIGGTPLAFLYFETSGTLPLEIDTETLQLQHLGKSLAHYAISMGKDSIAFSMVNRADYIEIPFGGVRAIDRLRKIPSNEIDIENVRPEIAVSYCTQSEILSLLQRMVDSGKIDEPEMTKLIARYHPEPVTLLLGRKLDEIVTRALAENDTWLSPKTLRSLKITKLNDSTIVEKIGSGCHYDKLPLLDTEGCEKLVKKFPESFSYLPAIEQKRLIRQLDNESFLIVFRHTEVYRLTAANRQLLEERRAFLLDDVPK